MIDYNKELIVFDLETPIKCFLASFYELDTNQFVDFIIDKNNNDLFKLVKYLKDNENKYFVGYNSLKFDCQIIEYIFDNITNFSNLSNLEISKAISDFGSKEIDNTNYGLFNTYKEANFTIKTIDLPCIWHFFNENKRVSLKQLEYEMRAETIENLEFDMNQDFNKEELVKLIQYCHNDINYTKKHLDYTIGNVEHKLYKGKDKLKDRLIIQDEVSISCLNYDDVKIGAEWNKKDYIQMSGRDEKEIKPKKVNTYFGKKFKQFFPKTVEFQTKELKSFIKNFGEQPVLFQKQDFIYKFSDKLQISLGKGGIHSNEKNRIINVENTDNIYIQNDIGSQYPNAIRKYKVYPKHLGIEWNNMLVSKIERRLNYKQLYKDTKDPKYNSLQEMGKLSLNGGAYGRLNTKGDWQEDPCCMLQVTVGCQLEILMIVEALILKGFEIVSVNTDGYDSIVPKDRLIEYLNICSFYEEKIGNKELGNLEYTRFDWIVQTSVNDYIAKKTGEFLSNGTFLPAKTIEYKCKGDFEYWKELHKNSSFSIIPYAYYKYFVNNISIENTINNHNDIFDFCARSNSGRTYEHLDITNSTLNSKVKLPKLIRYYVSKDGIHIKKMVKPEITTNANDMNVTPAEFKKTICNTLYEKDYEYHLSKVNKQWYIDKCNEIIFSVETGKKANRKIVDKNQIDMFA